METMARYRRRTERMETEKMNKLDAAWEKEIAKGTPERRAWGQVPESAYDTDAGGYDSEISEGSEEEELPDAEHYEQLRQEALCDEEKDEEEDEEIHPYAEEECGESDGDDDLMVECGAGAVAASDPVQKRTVTEQGGAGKQKKAKMKPSVCEDSRKQTSIVSFFKRK